MDWKETLGSLLSQQDTAAKQTEEQMAASEPERPQLTLFFEKRRGKPSTIITGYDSLPEERHAEARELASRLKQRLACGGSERDGEILLQGDVRQKVREILKSNGYKVKN